MSIKVNDSKDPVAEQDSLLVQVDYANQPIPNNRLPKGMYYSFKNKWVNILSLLTPDIKKIIASNTTTPTWGSITGTLSNQSDLQSALDGKMSSDLTDSHIFVGNTSNEATDVEMTGDVTIDNLGVTTLADTAVVAGTYGDATNVPQLTVDSKGRLTNVTNVAISGALVTPSALTKTDDTNVTLTLGGTPSTALLQAVSLTLGWAGTLADSRIASASTWNNKQNALGYTPEDVANKATSLTSPDNTKYPTTQAVADGLALKANITDVETILFKSSTTTVVTGKTLETSIYSIPLPNDGFNYIIEIYSQAQITTFAGAGITQRFRVGTYASPIDGLTGANSIGLQTLLATNGAAGPTQIELLRRYKYSGGASGSIYGFATGSNISDDANTLGPFTTLTSRDLTVQNYLYVTFNPTSSSAVISHSMITVKLIKI